MNRVGDDLLLDSLQRQEDYIHEAADAIDVKAGLILAAAAFLALQPSILLVAPHVSSCAFVAQLVSFLVLSLAVFFAHKVLKIEGYPNPGLSESWRDGVIDNAEIDATESDVREKILWGVVNATQSRVKDAGLINEAKLKLLLRSRRLTTVSFAINLLIVSAVLITRLF